LVHFEDGWELALQQGFQEIKFSHLTSFMEDSAACNRGAATTNIDLCAPSILTLLKKTLPSLYKKEDETYAEALVQAFKAKFVDMRGCNNPIPLAGCGPTKHKRRQGSARIPNLQLGAVPILPCARS
jgi:hypothetical protein